MATSKFKVLFVKFYHLVKLITNRLAVKARLSNDESTINSSIGYANHYAERPILTLEEGNKMMGQLLLSDQPCMISRLGNTELTTILYYTQNYTDQANLQWPEHYKSEINRQSGFFPPTDELISKFSEYFIEQIKKVDLMGVWHFPGEATIVNQFAKKAILAPLRSLEPYYFALPWSSLALEGKKVLVVHPFVETIKNQYSNSRQNLFEKDVLPEFTLLVFPAVQTLGETSAAFGTWFEAFDYMCAEISKIDFDIAIIGAGAFGLPLAAYVKDIGKKSVHLGGATQIMFGIRGKRWDSHPDISKMYNKFWVSPSPRETPLNKNTVADQGSYW